MDVALSVGVGADEPGYRGRRVVSSLRRAGGLNGLWLMQYMYGESKRKRRKGEVGLAQAGGAGGWNAETAPCKCSKLDTATHVTSSISCASALPALFYQFIPILSTYPTRRYIR